MRTKIMVALSLLILVVLNYAIYAKEQIRRSNNQLLVALRPADPRSIMQGDYMSLRYSLIDNISAAVLAAQPKRGDIVVRADDKGVAHFVRFYAGEQLSNHEKRLRYHRSSTALNIFPNAFFFQEGQAKYFRQAKYAIFNFDGSSSYLLVGLADKDRKPLLAPKEQS